MPTTNKPEYMEFIALMRSARRAKGLTQKDLASRLGKPQSFVSKVETCERRLDMIETAEWCLALGLDLDDVLPSKLRGALGRSSCAEQRSGEAAEGSR
jgi:transcriptional regulator with XRE-family HTH domain